MDFPEVGVSLSSDMDHVTVQPAGSIEATLPTDIDVSAFQREIDLPETVEAPVEQGQKLGTVTLTYNGQSYGQTDLLATHSVERSELLYRLDQIQKFFDQLWVKLVLAALAVLLVVLLIRRLAGGGRYGRRSGGARRTRYSGRRRR